LHDDNTVFTVVEHLSVSVLCCSFKDICCNIDVSLSSSSCTFARSTSELCWSQWCYSTNVAV